MIKRVGREVLDVVGNFIKGNKNYHLIDTLNTTDGGSVSQDPKDSPEMVALGVYEFASGETVAIYIRFPQGNATRVLPYKRKEVWGALIGTLEAVDKFLQLLT